MALCSASTRAGRPCRFAARRFTGLCVNHDPEYQHIQEANRLIGAQRSVESRTGAWREALASVPIDLATVRGRLRILEALMAMDLAGQLPAPIARRLLRSLAAATNVSANVPKGTVPP